MVRKIGQFLLNGEVVATPSILPLSNILGQDGRFDLKNILMDRCPKDDPTAKNQF